MTWTIPFKGLAMLRHRSQAMPRAAAMAMDPDTRKVRFARMKLSSSEDLAPLSF
jgi:hypothetical protein